MVMKHFPGIVRPLVSIPSADKASEWFHFEGSCKGMSWKPHEISVWHGNLLFRGIDRSDCRLQRGFWGLSVREPGITFGPK
jgi:hypothetical protein